MATLESLFSQIVVPRKTQGSHVWEPNKCKVADEASGHVPVSFASPVAFNTTSSGGSTTPLAQSTLSQSRGDTKLTAPCQALIDYFLLQFIICGDSIHNSWQWVLHGFCWCLVSFSMYFDLAYSVSYSISRCPPMLSPIDHTSSLYILQLKLL